VTAHGCTVRSPLTGCPVTSRPHDWFLRYSKWLDTFQTALIFTTLHGLTSQTTTDLKAMTVPELKKHKVTEGVANITERILLVYVLHQHT